MKQPTAGIIKHNKSGFTLVELLISISLLVLVVMAVLNIFDFGTKTYSTESKKAETNAFLRTDMDLILTGIRKSGASASDFTANTRTGIYRFDGNTSKGGHVFVIEFKNNSLKLTTDGAAITAYGEIYDFECVKEEGTHLVITITGAYVDSNGERESLTSYYYFRDR